MWVKLDDALLDHRKILEAGRAFTADERGPDGRIYALGLFSALLLYANKHLTDGFLSTAVLEELRLVTRVGDATRIMASAGFLKAVKGGWKIHDYFDHNPRAADVMEKRKFDRERKRKGGKRRHPAKGKSNGHG